MSLLKILPLALLAVLCGCKSTTFSQTLPNGIVVKATDRRFLVNTAAKIVGEIDPKTGIITITVDATSSPANETIKAITEGAVAGAVKGAKP